jgi:hypothetical protein
MRFCDKVSELNRYSKREASRCTSYLDPIILNGSTYSEPCKCGGYESFDEVVERWLQTSAEREQRHSQPARPQEPVGHATSFVRSHGSKK